MYWCTYTRGVTEDFNKQANNKAEVWSSRRSGSLAGGGGGHGKLHSTDSGRPNINHSLQPMLFEHVLGNAPALQAIRKLWIQM